MLDICGMKPLTCWKKRETKLKQHQLLNFYLSSVTSCVATAVSVVNV